MQQCGQMLAMGIRNLPQMLIVERRIAMFPNNPLFTEKLVQTKQEDIMREIQSVNAHDLWDQYGFSIEPKVKHRT